MKLLHWIQKQRNRKAGFTLVELIVVLVILAILAALLVPALTGYMDKAKEKQVIAETRSLLTAIQTEASELYAEDKIPQDNLSLQKYPALASKNGAASDAGTYFLTSNELKENYNKIVSQLKQNHSASPEIQLWISRIIMGRNNLIKIKVISARIFTC